MLSMVSSARGAESTFMTPVNDSSVNEEYSLDESTIKTLDPYNYDNQGKMASTALTVASSKKKSKTNVVTPRKSRNRSKSGSRKSAVSRANDEEKSRSGRSSSSNSSNTSDTPSRNNLTSTKMGPYVKDALPSTQKNLHSMMLPMKNLSDVKVPAHMVPLMQDPTSTNSRLTRQSLKRLKNDERSHSSDESHQKQAKKKDRK